MNPLRNLRVTFIAVATLFSLRPAPAATITWNGASGADTNWSDDANRENVGGGGASALQSDVRFGGVGSAGSTGTITSGVDLDQHSVSRRPPAEPKSVNA